MGYKNKDEKFDKLRDIAEGILKIKKVDHERYKHEIDEIIHELKVYQIELEVQNDELKKSNLDFSILQNRYYEFYQLAPIGYFTIDPMGLIRDVNLTGAKFLDVNKDELITSAFIRFIAPDSRRKFFKHINKLTQNGTNQKCDLELKNKRSFYVHIESKPFFDESGQIKEILMAIVDINELKKTEETLKKSLDEKQVLLRELNHRVKNNLQIIASLLHLQEEETQEEKYKNIIKESEGRVKSMALIHEKLYESENFAEINFKEYIENLVYTILYTYGATSETINIYFNIANKKFNIDTAIPLGLISNELVTNIVKHAFPKLNGRKGSITIELKTLGNNMVFTISDDGIGLPGDIDNESSDTLGLKIVNNLVNQLDGNIELIRDNGTKFIITFKELEYKDRK